MAGVLARGFFFTEAAAARPCGLRRRATARDHRAKESGASERGRVQGLPAAPDLQGRDRGPARLQRSAGGLRWDECGGRRADAAAGVVHAVGTIANKNDKPALEFELEKVVRGLFGRTCFLITFVFRALRAGRRRADQEDRALPSIPRRAGGGARDADRHGG